MSASSINIRNNIFFIVTAVVLTLIILGVSYSSIFLQKGLAAQNTASRLDRNFKLVIDAGHGGNDDGSKYNNIKEKNITLAIAEKIKTLAPLYGVDVIMTRSSDVFINPIGRVAFADHQNADVYVSIHVNELKAYNYVSGMQVYVSNHNPQFNQSCVLGSAVAKSLSTDFKVFNKLQDRAKNIYVLSENTLPAVLVECGFMTNPADLKMLTDSAQETLIAKQILEGVSAYKNNKVSEMYAVQLPRQIDTSRNKNIIASYHVIAPKKVLKKTGKITS